MAITINGTTGISGVDGSAGTPALQGSDPNTGIYSPGANQVAISTNGTGRLFVDASGKVGVSEPSAQANLHVAANISDATAITWANSQFSVATPIPGNSTANRSTIYFAPYGSDNNYAPSAISCTAGTSGASTLKFFTNASGNLTGDISSYERLRITSDAYVRLASGTGGIQFNGDTAAANALDDYEEGTWTVATVGISGTITANAGHYVKVGKMVTCWWDIYSSSNNLAWSGGHAAYLTGFPFAAVANIVGSGSVVRIDSAINSFQVNHFFEGGIAASTLKLEDGASSQRHLSGIINFITNT